MPQKPQHAEKEPWLTPQEAVALLRLPSVRALYQRIRRGGVKAYKFGRTLRFRASELNGAVQEQP